MSEWLQAYRAKRRMDDWLDAYWLWRNEMDFFASAAQQEALNRMCQEAADAGGVMWAEGEQ